MLQDHRQWRNHEVIQVRDVFHPDDLARLLYAQVVTGNHHEKRIFNVGGGIENSMSLAELSRWCADRFGNRKITADLQPRKFDVPWLVMDAGLAKTSWTWQISKPLSAILDEIAEHAAANPHWLELTTG
jgi:CDP-paratose 2-epimerase